MTLIKILFFSLIVSCFTFTQAARFNITNQCPYTVWAAALPSGGGRQLNPGETWPLDVASGTQAARIWGRTECNFDSSGRGRCQTGDCDSALYCQLSGQPPATLAEFTLNGANNWDYYDISVIDGFNVPMEFSPTSNGCSRGLRCTSYTCPDASHNPSDRKIFSCPSGANYRVVFCP